MIDIQYSVEWGGIHSHFGQSGRAVEITTISTAAKYSFCFFIPSIIHHLQGISFVDILTYDVSSIGLRKQSFCTILCEQHTVDNARS